MREFIDLYTKTITIYSMRERISPFEVVDDRQNFIKRLPLITRSEIFNRSAERAGEFLCPLSFIERQARRMRAKLEKINSRILGVPEHKVSVSTPPEWQTLLSFLHRQNVLQEPCFTAIPLYTDEPPFINLTLTFKPDASKTDGAAEKIYRCWGVSENFEEAASKVIGEVLERYTLAHYRTDSFVHGTARYVRSSYKGKVLDVSSVAGFADWQKEKFTNFKSDENSKFYWQRGIELTSGKKAWIPSQLIYINYAAKKHGEPYLMQPSSNGAAGYFTKERALLAGLYEYIQRDGFLRYWLAGKSPPQIDIDAVVGADHPIKKLINRFNRYGFQVVFLNTAHELPVPSCICVLIDESGVGPRYSIGGGASLNIGSALRSGLMETLAVHRWLRSEKRTIPFDIKTYEPFVSESIDRETRLLLLKDPVVEKQFEQIMLSGQKESTENNAFENKRSSFHDDKEELAFILSLYKKLDLEIYAYEAKHDILDALGYHVAKVIIPSYIPIYLKESFAPIGSKRLLDFIEKGKKPNPIPHSFP